MQTPYTAIMSTSSESVATLVPQLPPELHFRIVELMTDTHYLAHAWANFRLVSRTFKAITESVFARRHLPTAIIDFPTLTDTVYGGPCYRYGMGLTFSFVKLDGENSERAIFSERRPDQVEYSEGRCPRETDRDNSENTFYHCVAVEWQNCFFDFSVPVLHTTSSSGYGCPLTTRRVINDTAPPGLQVEWDRRSISLLWKEMFTVLFAEEEHPKRRPVQEGRADDSQKKISPTAGGFQSWLDLFYSAPKNVW
ncbi:hypothetical protein F5Y18DRAFT_376538 [Xylariaceae sp. FL1019]|nr:hypothetical protein F5Y18DRAFT_376538 [Xylariaceae sp. FL1019]